MTISGEIPDLTSCEEAQTTEDLRNPWKGAKEEQGSHNLLTIPLAPSVTEHKDELTTV